jgi:hypothetical protein
MEWISSVLVACLLGNLPGQVCSVGSLRVPVRGEDGHCQVCLEPYEPHEGDIVLFQAKGVVENVIYALAATPCTTHCGIVVRRCDGSLGLLEAPGTRYPVMVSDISTRLPYYNGKAWVRRLRCPLTCEQSACLTKFACAQEGKRFDTVGIVRPIFGLPVRLDRTKCCTDADLDQKQWFCSALVVAASVNAGLMDPCVVRPNFTDPQDLKVDTFLKLCQCWEEPRTWLRCGPRPDCGWWSQSCCWPGGDGCPPIGRWR